jgi:hypothetical protein
VGCGNWAGPAHAGKGEQARDGQYVGREKGRKKERGAGPTGFWPMADIENRNPF